MTLYTTDYLEYYLTLVAWVVNNGIWSILVASGVFALPFVAIVIQEWLKARSEGADEGNKGVLSSMRIENRVWVAIVVVIEALRDEPGQDMLGRRLASEAALSSVLEKALLLQRTLLTGKKEPNVAANELAVQAVDQENSALEQEINNLKTELELRRTLAGNSAMAIIQRHSTRAAGSRGVFEGDTTRDRLREVQKPRSGTP